MELLPNTASGGGRPPAGGGRNRWPKPRTHSRPPAWPPHAIHGNPGQALARLPQHHFATVARAAKASPSTEAGLQPGDLVEFERDNKAVLGLVTQADGKAKHFVMDQVMMPRMAFIACAISCQAAWLPPVGV
ncbi:hypothetical protein HaLaN_16059 [Haematococcus lacustris]|uniref:Ribonuclease II-like barrel domain-containing protein n=1 Tax=Haematococcus lacustris TaxID=44745 RepID=A0A699ZBQ8_HAELA|nr:hypothetical protein HaLaN_16059 [Haematococcus lacustris]